jgi:hypothetical protein
MIEHIELQHPNRNIDIETILQNSLRCESCVPPRQFTIKDSMRKHIKAIHLGKKGYMRPEEIVAEKERQKQITVRTDCDEDKSTDIDSKTKFFFTT